MRVRRVTRVLLVFTLVTVGCVMSMHREVVPPDQVDTIYDKARTFSPPGWSSARTANLYH